MDEYEFSAFLDSIKLFIESMKDGVTDPLSRVNGKAFAQQRALQRFETSKKGSQHLKYHAGLLAAQIGHFRFWLAGQRRPPGMADSDFALIEPICRSLVDKGMMQTSALDLFRFRTP